MTQIVSPRVDRVDGRLSARVRWEAASGTSYRAGMVPVHSSWAALAGVSLLLVLLALAVPEAVGAALAATGVAGLFIVRLAAMREGWAPRGRHDRTIGLESVALATPLLEGSEMREHTDGVHAPAADSSGEGRQTSERDGALRADRERSRFAPRVFLEDLLADHVDEASEDSFPASDPPAWAAMRVGPPRANR